MPADAPSLYDPICPTLRFTMVIRDLHLHCKLFMIRSHVVTILWHSSVTSLDSRMEVSTISSGIVPELPL